MNRVINVFKILYKHFIFYSLILTNSGHLLELCPFTKLLLYSSSAQEILIDDLIVMECSDETIELLVLTKRSQEHERLIKILDYPGKVFV